MRNCIESDGRKWTVYETLIYILGGLLPIPFAPVKTTTKGK
jgi:hypothetical protein